MEFHPEPARDGTLIVYAAVDDALLPDFPLGDSLEVFIRRARTPSGSSSKCGATSRNSRRS
jgi:hypothetical protein